MLDWIAAPNRSEHIEIGLRVNLESIHYVLWISSGDDTMTYTYSIVR